MWAGVGKLYCKLNKSQTFTVIWDYLGNGQKFKSHQRLCMYHVLWYEYPEAWWWQKSQKLVPLQLGGRLWSSSVGELRSSWTIQMLEKFGNLYCRISIFGTLGFSSWRSFSSNLLPQTHWRSCKAVFTLGVKVSSVESPNTRLTI